MKRISITPGKVRQHLTGLLTKTSRGLVMSIYDSTHLEAIAAGSS